MVGNIEGSIMKNSIKYVVKQENITIKQQKQEKTQ